jgi:hypothetical protein
MDVTNYGGPQMYSGNLWGRVSKITWSCEGMGEHFHGGRIAYACNAKRRCYPSRKCALIATLSETSLRPVAQASRDGVGWAGLVPDIHEIPKPNGYTVPDAMALNPDMCQSEFVVRDYTYATLQWKNTDAAGTHLHASILPQETLGSPAARRVFEQWYYWKGDVVIGIHVNCNAYQTGILRGWFAPAGHEIAEDNYNLASATALGGVDLKLPEEKDKYLKIGWFARQRFFSTTFTKRMDGEDYALGVFRLTVLAQLNAGTNTDQNQLAVTLSAFFPDPVFQELRLVPLSADDSQVFTDDNERQMAREDRTYPFPSARVYEYRRLQNLEAMRARAAERAIVQGNSSSQVYNTTVVSGGDADVHDINKGNSSRADQTISPDVDATIPIEDFPSATGNGVPVFHLGVQPFANVAGMPFVSNILDVDTGTNTRLDQGTTGIGVDEMEHVHFRRESYWTSFRVAPTDATQTIVFQSYITPAPVTNQMAWVDQPAAANPGSTPWDAPMCEVALLRAMLWRGSLRLRIRAANNGFARCRLAVVTVYGDSVAPPTNFMDAGNQSLQIMSLDGSQSQWDVTLPFHYPRNWAKIWRTTCRPYSNGGGVPTAAEIKRSWLQCSPGKFYIMVMQELSYGQVSPQPLDFLVYMSLGDDFAMAGLNSDKGLTLYAGGVPSALEEAVSRPQAQGGEETVEGEEEAPPTSIAPHETTAPIVKASETDASRTWNRMANIQHITKRLVTNLVIMLVAYPGSTDNAQAQTAVIPVTSGAVWYRDAVGNIRRVDESPWTFWCHWFVGWYGTLRFHIRQSHDRTERTRVEFYNDHIQRLDYNLVDQNTAKLDRFLCSPGYAGLSHRHWEGECVDGSGRTELYPEVPTYSAYDWLQTTQFGWKKKPGVPGKPKIGYGLPIQAIVQQADGSWAPTDSSAAYGGDDYDEDLYDGGTLAITTDFGGQPATTAGNTVVNYGPGDASRLVRFALVPKITYQRMPQFDVSFPRASGSNPVYPQ